MSLRLVAIPVVSILMLVVMVVLSQFIVESTPIDLAATAQSVSFRTASDDAALEPFLIEEISIVGRGRVEGVPGVAAITSYLTLSRIAGAQPLALQSLKLAKGTGVTLRRVPGQVLAYELFIGAEDDKSPVPDITVFAPDGYQLGTGRDARLIRPAVAAADKPAPPAAVRIEVEEPRISLRLRLAEPEWRLALPVMIASLSLFDVDQQKNGAPRLFSTIGTGSVRFEQLQTIDGRDVELTLRAGQPLELGGLQDGFLRELRLDGREIGIGMVGSVAKLVTLGRERNHMPSILGVLSSRDDLKAFGVLFALFLALAQVIGLGARAS